MSRLRSSISHFQEVALELSRKAARSSTMHHLPAGDSNMEVFRAAQIVHSFQQSSSLDASSALIGSRARTTPRCSTSVWLVQRSFWRRAAVREMMMAIIQQLLVEVEVEVLRREQRLLHSVRRLLRSRRRLRSVLLPPLRRVKPLPRRPLAQHRLIMASVVALAGLDRRSVRLEQLVRSRPGMTTIRSACRC